MGTAESRVIADARRESKSTRTAYWSFARSIMPSGKVWVQNVRPSRVLLDGKSHTEIIDDTVLVRYIMTLEFDSAFEMNIILNKIMDDLRTRSGVTAYNVTHEYYLPYSGHIYVYILVTFKIKKTTVHESGYRAI